jgi:hypothetical protein
MTQIRNLGTVADWPKECSGLSVSAPHTLSYSKLRDDLMFRKQVAEHVGIGFELPAEKPELALYCTHATCYHMLRN